MHFRNRTDAGRRLARSPLIESDEPVVVLGLPRGGVPVAAEVAAALHAPLDVLVVRKLGVPRQPELAMGAIGEGGIRLIDEQLVQAAGVSADELAAVEADERRELDRRAQRYRDGRGPLALDGRCALVVDDGMATGSTALAAVRVARQLGAVRVVVAVPVGSRAAIALVSSAADQVVCLAAPTRFHAVGQWYDDFAPTSDDEVVAALARRSGEDGPMY